MVTGKQKLIIILSIWILILFLLTLLSLISDWLRAFFWIIFLPLSFMLLIVFQALSDQFWTSKKKCPICNYQVSIYSEYCRNCGFKLMIKCPSCNRYLTSDSMKCKFCGQEIPALVTEKKSLDYQKMQKSTLSPGRANFCSNCGSNLMKEDPFIELCPVCGENIN